MLTDEGDVSNVADQVHDQHRPLNVGRNGIDGYAVAGTVSGHLLPTWSAGAAAEGSGGGVTGRQGAQQLDRHPWLVGTR